MITLVPGEVPLAAWRAVYRGGAVALAAGQDRIAASAAAVQAILARGEPAYGINTGFGKLAHVRIGAGDLMALQRNIVLSHAAGVGAPMPVPVARLMLALKLGSLAQGASGVQPQTVALLEAMLGRGLVPVVPDQGSVGASGDLAPLAHMAAAMIGVGEMFVDGVRVPAAAALERAGLVPAVLGPKEGLALLNGTQFSTAYALAGLFEAELLWRTALVVGALATDAARGSDTPFDPRIHALRRHRGQVDAAAALRALIADSEIRRSHLVGDDRVQDPYCLRCQPQVMGAVLDILRHTAATLGTEANGVTDNPLIFPETLEALSGGNFHAEPVAFAADIIALALCEVGSIAERRLAMLIDLALSGLPAFLTPRPGLLRLHDRARHRRRPGVGEQAARDAGQRRQHPHVSQPGGPRFDGGARGPAAAADGGKHGGGAGDRAAGGCAGLRLPRAAAVQPGARTGAGRVAAGGAGAGRGPLLRPRHRGRDPAGHIGRHRRRGARDAA